MKRSYFATLTKLNNATLISSLALAILYINAECTPRIIIFFYVFMPFLVSAINANSYLECILSQLKIIC